MIGLELEKKLKKWSDTVHDFCSEIECITSSEKYAVRWLLDKMGVIGPLYDAWAREVGGSYIRPISPALGGPYIKPISSALLVMPGTGLTSGIHQLFWFYCGVADDGKITLSLSLRDVWTRRFVEFLNDDRITIVDSARSISNSELRTRIGAHDVLSVSGSNDTIQRYKQQTPTRVKTLFYGQKRSVAIHDTEEITNEDVDGYMDDITIHEGLGCLNTSTLYLRRSTYQKNRDQIIQLSERVRDTVMSDYGVAAFNEIQKWTTDVYDEDGTIEVLGTFRVREANWKEFRQTVGFGTLEIALYDDIDQVEKELSINPSINSSATIDDFSPSSEVVDMLVRSGFSRVTRVGTAQSPSLSWRHDGYSNITWATNFVTVE